MLSQCFDLNGVFKRVVLATAVIFLAAGCAPEPETEAPQRSVKAMQVLPASSVASRVFPGRAEAGQEVNLSFRVSGPLIELPVKVGDKVRQGDVLARIDPKDYQSVLLGLEAQLQSAQATANRAQSDFQRIDNTYREDPGATTEMALDRARQLRDSTAAAVRTAQATVESARDQLSYTNLVAPFDGEVVETYVENFESVLPKQPILRVVDPTYIEVTISVPENQIVYAPYITSARVSFDALPGITVPATIKKIGKEASQATRTYPVTLVLEQPEGAEILPGMASEVKIEAELPENSDRLGIQLPTTALFTQDDPQVTYIWVIDRTTDSLQRREVQTGDLSEFGVLIKSGLEAEEWVVVAGVSLLSEGDPVKILGLPEESEAQ